jgi:multidrug efflux pump subunit AcrA (membrane-fusion protein)
MMNSEILLQKIAAGETVSAADIMQIEANEKLLELKAEAARRAEARRIAEGREKTREQKLDEMVLLDARAEAARRKFENVVAAKQKIAAELEAAERQAVSEWHLAYAGFLANFAGFVPEIRGMGSRVYENQGELEKRVSELKDALKAKGARLENVLYNYSNLGRSYLDLVSMPPFDAAENGETEPREAAEAKAAT